LLQNPKKLGIKRPAPV